MAKINEVMQLWKNYSPMNLHKAYLDSEFDLPMNDLAEPRSMPVEGSYTWCITCEEFGHLMGEKPEGCNMTKLESRAPADLRSNAIITAKPFVPAGFKIGSWTALSGGNAIQTRCTTYNCDKILTWTVPMPALGQYLTCPSCKQQIAHPHDHTRKRSSVTASVDNVIKLVELITGVEHANSKYSAADLEMFHQRPSLRLKQALHSGFNPRRFDPHEAQRYPTSSPTRRPLCSGTTGPTSTSAGKTVAISRSTSPPSRSSLPM
ncbi:hypothetical protein BU23DRAFT_551217, partial [Bimuria novae-zelandiae CBS 107.79]